MARAHHERDPSEDRYARQRMEAANALEQAIAELAADVEVGLTSSSRTQPTGSRPPRSA